MAALAKIQGNLLVHLAYLIVLLVNYDGIMALPKDYKSEQCQIPELHQAIHLFLACHILGVAGPIVEVLLSSFLSGDSRLVGTVMDFVLIPVAYIAQFYGFNFLYIAFK